jgi:hypothetical protein
VADHPLRPAKDRRLGRPLPHQLADGTQTDLSTRVAPLSSPSANLKRTYVVLARVSPGYPSPIGTLSTCYSPVRHFSRIATSLVRLACVKHAASVRSEPGSNSPIKLVGTNASLSCIFDPRLIGSICRLKLLKDFLGRGFTLV